MAKLRLTESQVTEFIETIELVSTRLDDVVETFACARDPDDAHYINLALAANAELIASRDNDLLSLMDPAKPEALEFQLRWPTLRILEPLGFLRLIHASAGSG